MRPIDKTSELLPELFGEVIKEIKWCGERGEEVRIDLESGKIYFLVNPIGSVDIRDDKVFAKVVGKTIEFAMTMGSGFQPNLSIQVRTSPRQVTCLDFTAENAGRVILQKSSEVVTSECWYDVFREVRLRFRVFAKDPLQAAEKGSDLPLASGTVVSDRVVSTV